MRHVAIGVLVEGPLVPGAARAATATPKPRRVSAAPGK